MKKIVIFAGTTEGRRLAEILADAGIAHTVCVATEYGEIVMREQTDAESARTMGQPVVSLHRCRIDRQEMEEFLRSEGYEIVVDATHPYAQVVTENIRDAVKTQSSIYLRLEREISETPEAENPVVSIRYFESNADCAKALENTYGNILLTIGAVVSGGIFGDHCSPLSDTTILSSMSVGTDLYSHVKTQLPYALVTAACAAALYIAFGLIL